MVFRPSPTQSPAAATTVVAVVGNEFNTTLVGSNNISLNKVFSCQSLKISKQLLKLKIKRKKKTMEIPEG